MRTKWYKITGITNEMYKEWKDELREDIIVYEENGERHFKMKLTALEAFQMRQQMKRINLNNPCVLKLEKDMRDYFTTEKKVEA